ncbi:hypothetical protein COW53_09190 [bacterium CG17_big_fil_post_rev_8_21_14_2_50_64_8]|nr:MAG: hypothetical protein COW53_09190 [bacterium CG17_big_fil_post_rev_8_21_14_2_50_64_8]
MSPRPNNFPIDEAIRAQFQSLREEQNLSRTKLSEMSGVSVKTIMAIETGKRKRCQESTVMILAEALGITLADLKSGNGIPSQVSDFPIGGKIQNILRARSFWAILIVFLVSLFGAGWFLAGTHGIVIHEDMRLEYRDPWFNLRIWQMDPQIKVRSWRRAPWSDRVLLLGLRDQPNLGDQYIAVSTLTGKMLWGVSPDYEQLNMAFGAAIVGEGYMRFIQDLEGDLDGDGTPEIFAQFTHSLNFPSCVCRISRNGELISQYSSNGHIDSVISIDVDNDLKDELICAGTNNSPHIGGATVFLLDDQYNSGASVDPWTHPYVSLADSSRFRLVIPNFPREVMRFMSEGRLRATSIQPSTIRGTGRITVEVGTADELSRVVVFLDSELHPLDSIVKDSFLESLDRLLGADVLSAPGPWEAGWREEWLNRSIYFREGAVVEHVPWGAGGMEGEKSSR